MRRGDDRIVHADTRAQGDLLDIGKHKPTKFSQLPGWEDGLLLPFALNHLTSRINRAWLAHLRGTGLTAQRWQVLSILNTYDGSRIGIIADLSGLDQPVLSRVIDQMERDGLVMRKTAPEDNRAVEVWITEAGQGALGDLMPVAEEFMRHLMRDQSPEEIKSLMHILSQLMQKFDGDAPA